MAFGDHLLHTCTVQRADTSQVDAYRQTKRVWADLATGLACRLVERSQRVYSHERAQLLTVTTYALLLPAGSDVRPDDRITDVADGGAVLDAGPFKVASVLARRGRAEHHVSLVLERVT